MIIQNKEIKATSKVCKIPNKTQNNPHNHNVSLRRYKIYTSVVHNRVFTSPDRLDVVGHVLIDSRATVIVVGTSLRGNTIL